MQPFEWIELLRIGRHACKQRVGRNSCIQASRAWAREPPGTCPLKLVHVQLQAAVAGFEEEQLSNLLGEDPNVAVQRKQLKSRIDMLRKAVHEISSFTG